MSATVGNSQDNCMILTTGCAVECWPTGDVITIQVVDGRKPTVFLSEEAAIRYISAFGGAKTTRVLRKGSSPPLPNLKELDYQCIPRKR